MDQSNYVFQVSRATEYASCCVNNEFLLLSIRIQRAFSHMFRYRLYVYTIYIKDQK